MQFDKIIMVIASVMLLVLEGGCAGAMKEERTLRPPAGTAASAATAVEEGNRLFASRQWALAKAQYELAIKAQPTLAEAHYNLALANEMLGDDGAARRHYIEAANLAPGHKVIWDSPPLRRHGLVEPGSKGETLITPGRSSH
jgi:Flp pilus assembly protein TadD